VTRVTAAEGARLDELEMERPRQLGENRHSLAKGGGLDVEPVLVDQAVADEGAGESGTSVGDVLSRRSPSLVRSCPRTGTER
jgi:hypothetical protein